MSDRAEAADDRRMTDSEALMWALDQDPVLRSSYANLTLLDRPPDLDRFRARMARACRLVPRLRRRVTAGSGLGTPAWVEDPLFDLDFHVRHLALPTPGTERQLLDLAARLAEDPFDRARPLWQFVIVEGLADGRAAMLQKLHHTVTDGEGGIRLSTMFIDLEPDATAPLDGAEDPGEGLDVGGGEILPDRNAAEVVWETLADGVRRPLDLARSALGGAVGAVTHPAQAPGRASDAIEASRSLLRQLAVTEPARSPLWTERSLRRRLEVLRVPLDGVKKAASSLGGTVNDVFMAGAAAGAGAYHRRKGMEVDELRVAMPVSTRIRGQSGGNAFVPTRMVVPVAADDPAAHFRSVQAVLASTKSERGLGLASRMAGLLAGLPDPVLLRVARQQVGTVDFTASNVRGAPVTCWIAGAEVLANHPLGPMAGTAFNLTTLSYRDSLDMGCLVDPAAVDEPELLRDCLSEAYEDLLALA